jgi:hypothetical protein
MCGPPDWRRITGLSISLHEVESFLRSRQSLSYSRISQNVTEAESLLPSSEEHAPGPYPEPDQSNSYTPILSPIRSDLAQDREQWRAPLNTAMNVKMGQRIWLIFLNILIILLAKLRAGKFFIA